MSLIEVVTTNAALTAMLQSTSSNHSPPVPPFPHNHIHPAGDAAPPAPEHPT